MKQKLKLLSILGITGITCLIPLALSNCANYQITKTSNSRKKQDQLVLNKAKKNTTLNLYSNTNYGTTQVQIGQNASGEIDGISNSNQYPSWLSNKTNLFSKSANSYLNTFQTNLFQIDSDGIPEGIDFSKINNLTFIGSLCVWIQSYCSHFGGSPSNSITITLNSINAKQTFSLNNDGGEFWYWGAQNYAPLLVNGTFGINNISNNGNINFFLKGNAIMYPAPSGKSWPYNSVSDPELQFYTGTTLINGQYLDEYLLTLPFNMNTIESNIQNAISSYTCSQYEYESQISTSVTNTIDQMINGCIPPYMSNVFTINTQLSNYGATSATLTTNMAWTNGADVPQIWKFTTNISMPPQPSNQNAYEIFQNAFSNPITLVSNTSNVWDSNDYWGNSTVPKIVTPPKEWSYIQQGSNIYYNGLVNNNLTWCTNQAILENYVQDTLFNYCLNTIQAQSTIATPNPFSSNNPISITSVSFDTKNNTNYVVTKLTFQNNYFNTTNNINIDSNPSPWVFYTPVSLALSSYYYSGSVAQRIVIKAQAMPIASSFQTIPDNGYELANSASTQTNNSNTGTGYINAGTWLYYSTAELYFTGNDLETDTLTINGQEVQVINNNFEYTLQAPLVTNKNEGLNHNSNDPSTNSSNNSSNKNSNSNSNNTNNTSNNSVSISKTYLIQIYRIGKLIYQKTIVIYMGVPGVQFKWYAWDPSTKPWQEALITKNLANGKPNPQYNSKINASTGAINQILWVNQNTPNNEPYFADPYDVNNEKYPTNQPVPSSDLGYIADGEVFNKGVSVNWNTNNGIVYRQGLSVFNDELVPSNNPTNNPYFNGIGKYQEIQPNSKSINTYFSYSGIWEYSVQSVWNGNPDALPNNTGIYSYYLIDVINSNNEQQINEFTNVVKTTTVVTFWTSIHGEHLANYLKNVQNMSNNEIQALSYTQVQYWWNMYCANTLALENTSYQTFNLSNASIHQITMNTSNETTIKNIISTDIEQALSAYQLVNNVDYKINVTQAQIQTLANYQSDPNGTCNQTITVTSLNTNICTGELSINVTDSIDAINLNQINFGTIDVGVVGNSSSDLVKLQNEIISAVETSINDYAQSENIKVAFKYGVAWNINWSHLDQLEINDMQTSALAYIQVYAMSNSAICYGSNWILVHNSTLYTNPYNFLNLNQIHIPTLKMNLTNSNTQLLEAEISNYIFANINTAFKNYFATHNINPVIENELNFNWNSSIYSNNSIIYPSTYTIFWYINNYVHGLETLVQNASSDQNNFNNEVTLYILPTAQGTKNLCGAIPFFINNSSSNPKGISTSPWTYPNSNNQPNHSSNNSSNNQSNKNTNNSSNSNSNNGSNNSSNNSSTSNSKNPNTINNLINLNNVIFGNLKISILGNSASDIANMKNTVINEVSQAINNYALTQNIHTNLKNGVNFNINWNNLSKLLVLKDNVSATAFLTVSAIANNGLCTGLNSVYVTNEVNTNTNIISFDLANIKIPDLEMNLQSSNLNVLLAHISNYIFSDIEQAFKLYFSQNPSEQDIANLLNFHWNSSIYSSNSIIYPSTYNKSWTIMNYTNLLNELAHNANTNNFNNDVVLYITPFNNNTELYGAIPLFVNNSSNNPLTVSGGKFNFPKNNLAPNHQTNNSKQQQTKSFPAWIITVIVVSVLVIAFICWLIYIRVHKRKFI